MRLRHDIHACKIGHPPPLPPPVKVYKQKDNPLPETSKVASDPEVSFYSNDDHTKITNVVPNTSAAPDAFKEKCAESSKNDPPPTQTHTSPR